MTDTDLCGHLPLLAHWEGRIGWPYLDNAEEPNVTIGIGCLIATVDDLRALPMRRYADDEMATPAELGAEFCRVRLMPGGQRAAAYRGRYYLPATDIDALALERLHSLVSGLPAVFPAFERLPGPAQSCLIDLGWNAGLGKLPGLRGWIHLRGALAEAPPNWELAAENCTMANPKNLSKRAARNGWRVSCMVAAGEGRAVPVPA
jgi:hypothetical protein